MAGRWTGIAWRGDGAALNVCTAGTGAGVSAPGTVHGPPTPTTNCRAAAQPLLCARGLCVLHGALGVPDLFPPKPPTFSLFRVLGAPPTPQRFLPSAQGTAAPFPGMPSLRREDASDPAPLPRFCWFAVTCGLPGPQKPRPSLPSVQWAPSPAYVSGSHQAGSVRRNPISSPVHRPRAQGLNV